ECGRTGWNLPEGWPAEPPEDRVFEALVVASRPAAPPSPRRCMRAVREKRTQVRTYLATTATSFFAAQTKATIQPITLHPRKRFNRKMARISRLLRASAMI